MGKYIATSRCAFFVQGFCTLEFGQRFFIIITITYKTLCKENLRLFLLLYGVSHKASALYILLLLEKLRTRIVIKSKE